LAALTIPRSSSNMKGKEKKSHVGFGGNLWLVITNTITFFYFDFFHSWILSHHVIIRLRLICNFIV
jgi:hypothetical protein